MILGDLLQLGLLKNVCSGIADVGNVGIVAHYQSCGQRCPSVGHFILNSVVRMLYGCG
jgi:hypothetical protein